MVRVFECRCCEDQIRVRPAHPDWLDPTRCLSCGCESLFDTGEVTDGLTRREAARLAPAQGELL